MKYLRLLVVSFLFLLITLPVGARGITVYGARPSIEPNTRRATATLSAQEKRDENRANVCERRFSAISKRMDSLMSRVVSMLGKFDAILARIQEYYTTTAVPAGNEIDDYDVLVADIVEKKVVVNGAVVAAELSQTSFTCETSEPKELYSQYREDMQGVKSALHEYRRSIKDLIVAVRTAKSEE